MLVTAADDLELLGRVLDDPTATLQEHSTHILMQHGKSVSVPTLCRAMKRLGLTHKKVSRAQLRLEIPE